MGGTEWPLTTLQRPSPKLPHLPGCCGQEAVATATGRRGKAREESRASRRLDRRRGQPQRTAPLQRQACHPSSQAGPWAWETNVTGQHQVLSLDKGHLPGTLADFQAAAIPAAPSLSDPIFPQGAGRAVFRAAGRLLQRPPASVTSKSPSSCRSQKRSRLWSAPARVPRSAGTTAVPGDQAPGLFSAREHTRGHIPTAGDVSCHHHALVLLGTEQG